MSSPESDDLYGVRDDDTIELNAERARKLMREAIVRMRSNTDRARREMRNNPALTRIQAGRKYRKDLLADRLIFDRTKTYADTSELVHGANAYDYQTESEAAQFAPVGLTRASRKLYRHMHKESDELAREVGGILRPGADYVYEDPNWSMNKRMDEIEKDREASLRGEKEFTMEGGYGPGKTNFDEYEAHKERRGKARPRQKQSASASAPPPPSAARAEYDAAMEQNRADRMRLERQGVQFAPVMQRRQDVIDNLRHEEAQRSLRELIRESNRRRMEEAQTSGSMSSSEPSIGEKRKRG